MPLAGRFRGELDPNPPEVAVVGMECASSAAMGGAAVHAAVQTLSPHKLRHGCFPIAHESPCSLLFPRRRAAAAAGAVARSGAAARRQASGRRGVACWPERQLSQAAGRKQEMAQSLRTAGHGEAAERSWEAACAAESGPCPAAQQTQHIPAS